MDVKNIYPNSPIFFVAYAYLLLYLYEFSVEITTRKIEDNLQKCKKVNNSFQTSILQLYQ